MVLFVLLCSCLLLWGCDGGVNPSNGTTEQTTGAVTDCTHVEEMLPGKEETCAEVGLTEGKKCSLCGEILLTQEETPLKEHMYVDKKCSVCGVRQPSEGLIYAENDDGTYSVSGIGTCTDIDVVIPTTYNGQPVTAIRIVAFQDCTGLTSVTIPDSVTSIGDYAFHECTTLTDIYYTGSESEWAAITKGIYAIPSSVAIHYNSVPTT